MRTSESLTFAFNFCDLEIYGYYDYEPAAVWRWIGSLRVFSLCVYSFLICLFFLGVFGAHFALLGATLGFLLGALGAPWAPKGPSLASFWAPLAPLGLRGAIWGTLGSQGELGMTSGPKWRSNSEQMALK